MATATQQPAQPHQATASGSSFDETAATASPQARTAASSVTEDHRQEADDGDHATEDEEDDPPRYAHLTHHQRKRTLAIRPTQTFFGQKAQTLQGTLGRNVSALLF